MTSLKKLYDSISNTLDLELEKKLGISTKRNTEIKTDSATVNLHICRNHRWHDLVLNFDFKKSKLSVCQDGNPVESPDSAEEFIELLKDTVGIRETPA